jgi:hypothetical protein
MSERLDDVCFQERVSHVYVTFRGECVKSQRPLSGSEIHNGSKHRQRIWRMRVSLSMDIEGTNEGEQIFTEEDVYDVRAM